MWQHIVDTAAEWSSTVIIAAVGVIAVTLVHRFFWRRHSQPESKGGLLGPMTTALVVGIVTIATTLSLPIGDSARGQLLGLLGLLVTAAVALSSTTLLGNALAGIMLRAIRGFGLGDYLRVGDFAGRVSELGILHTEIQSEDRDLITLPNLFLVTHPVTVLRSTGTVVSATVSLGYEHDYHEIEELLLTAGTRAGLSDTFVQIDELGDFSITYRAAGILTEVRQLLTARSRIRKSILDTLHAAGVEIVSPTFMNQRILDAEASFIPKTRKSKKPRTTHIDPEDIIFDKANLAEAKAKLVEQIRVQVKLIEDLEKSLDAGTLEAERESIGYQLREARERLHAMRDLMEFEEAEIEKT